MQDRFEQSESLIAARITPPGRGAVAVIAVSGPDDRAAIAIERHFRPFRGGRVARQHLIELSIPLVAYGHWGTEPAEDVMLCHPEPSQWEIHCHGGDAASRRILDDLAAEGCTVAAAGEWTIRRYGLLLAEQEAALGNITTTRAAVHFAPQFNGFFQSFVEELLRCDSASELRRRLEKVLCWRLFASRLLTPPVVAILGRPNAGKSSLLNRLLGRQRAIVSPVAGTTRDVVSSHAVFEGWGVELADTAGLREQASDTLEHEGQARALRRAAAADLTLLVLDQGEPLHADDLRLLQTHRDAIVVLNKDDLPPRLNRGALAGRTICPVSAMAGTGIDELQSAIVQRLFPDEPPAGTPLATSPRQWDLLERARVAASEGNLTASRAVLREL